MVDTKIKSNYYAFLASILAVAVIGLVSVANADYTNLYDFTDTVVDGASPYGSLIRSGNVLYGMTENGGISNKGVVFKIDSDGNNYTTLHDFTGVADDGALPHGSLILSESTLYGMAAMGGASNVGVIFKIDVDGNNYANLHDFATGVGNGAYPKGSLILSDNTLYGMTPMGGLYFAGVVFKIDITGNNYTNLHEFSSDANDGENPQGSLVLSGSTLYGMTQNGGVNFQGVIFKIDITGNNYSHLHEFSSDANGKNPFGSLLLLDDTFYGMTSMGGSDFQGVIFKMNVTGSNYTNLHNFTGAVDDGGSPFGSLIVSDYFLAGMTGGGGVSSAGVIFTIDIDGSNYTNLHSFANGGGNGSLLEYDDAFYGMTFAGGVDNQGVIFKQFTPIPEPATMILSIIICGFLFKKSRK